MEFFLIHIECVALSDDLAGTWQAHVTYMESAINQGMVLLSASHTDESGGFMLARADSQANLEALLALDPLYRNGFCSFRIRPFQPERHDAMLIEWVGPA